MNDDHRWEPKHYVAVVLLLIALGVLFVLAVETVTVVRPA